MISYILHVSLLLGLGFILYQVLLKKETFYSLNRVILASYLILAFSLPLIQIPEAWSLKDVNPIVHQKKTNEKKKSTEGLIVMNKAKKTVTENNEVHPGTSTNANTTEDSAGMAHENQASQQEAFAVASPSFTERVQNAAAQINWATAIKWTYIIGLGIFLINFLVQFFILIYYRLKFPILKDGRLTIVEMEGDKAPFSFLNMIYINPSKYDYDTYEQILAHEKIHIEKWHSFDIFLSELALIILWFNPFAWMYRKVVEHNLEYLTDQEMLASGANAEVYQMNLLKVSVPELPLSLSTNYNQSFLKKRIHMMNAKKSSARSTWKYLFILPILGLTIALFNPTFITAQNTEQETPEQLEVREELPTLSQRTDRLAQAEKIEREIQENKFELIESKEELEQSLSTISDLSMLDIDPEVDLSITETETGYAIVSSDLQTFMIDTYNDKTIVRSASEDLQDEGVWEAELRNNKVCLYIKKGGIGKNYFWSSSECFLATDFTPAIKNNTEGEFSLTRDPGTLVLKGEFTSKEGTGRYTFTPNPSFISAAQSSGFQISEEKLIHFFLSGMDKSFFGFLKSNGYTKVSEDELLSLAIHDVNEEYIKNVNGEFQKVNYEKPSVEELVSLKIHDVDMEYIKSFGKELYEDLKVDQIIAAAIHDVDPNYISEFKSLGYSDLTFDNLISAAIHDVDVEFVRKLKGAGFDDLSFDNLVAAAIHDVDPEYIKKFKNAGFKDLTFDNLISAAIHNVDPEYITAFEQAGIDMNFDNLISAAIHNIDVDYIKEFQDAGFEDLTFDQLVSAGIHNVDVDYLKKAKSYGFDLTFDQLIAASIHGVDLEYVEVFSKAGIKNVTFDDMVSASIHGVDPEFIKAFNDLGYNDLTFDNLISAAIHGVSIDFIKGFKESGMPDLTFDDFISASIHGIRPEFIKEVKDAGLSNVSFENIVSFGIHGVDVKDIKGLKDMGFDLTPEKYIEASIHGVTPKFIKKMQDKGHTGLSFDEYVKLKIHGF